MTTIHSHDAEALQEALMAPELSPEIPVSADIYGWLVGSWDLDIRHYWVDVSAQHLRGEVHFARVLEGRAVQDVWIMPRREDRRNHQATQIPMAPRFGSGIRRSRHGVSPGSILPWVTGRN